MLSALSHPHLAYSSHHNHHTGPGSLDKKSGRKISSMFHLCLIKDGTVFPPGVQIGGTREKALKILVSLSLCKVVQKNYANLLILYTVFVANI
jgi:hypothetical protein